MRGKRARACGCVSSSHAATASLLLQKAWIAHTATADTGGRRMFNFTNPPVNESGPPCENSGMGAGGAGGGGAGARGATGRRGCYGFIDTWPSIVPHCTSYLWHRASLEGDAPLVLDRLVGGVIARADPQKEHASRSATGLRASGVGRRAKGGRKRDFENDELIQV